MREFRYPLPMIVSTSCRATLAYGFLSMSFLACGAPTTGQALDARASEPRSASSAPMAHAEQPAAQPAPDAPDPRIAAPGAATPLAPQNKPAPVPRSGKVWPFHAWDRAEAVTFNQFAIRPSTQLEAYSADGWSPSLVDRKPISHAQATKAVGLVARTEGGVEVSKCPFPRHAVVLYEGQTPVASINVCFACGDILLWPSWEPAPDWDAMSDRQIKAAMMRSEQQMKLYDRVFPSWKAFFRDEVGFSIDARYE